MPHLNVEIKASCQNHEAIRAILKAHKADFKGTDHQVDTYFKVTNGRLKLREGNIENFLVFYERENQPGPKASAVSLFKNEPNSSLKELLTKSLTILTVVDKQREIYFIDNVKFHLDTVKDLGTFVEIEAIDKDDSIKKDKLQEQCAYYMKLLDLKDNDLLSVSYSDLLLAKRKNS